MINNIKLFWHSIPPNAGVFFFYVLHWICGRIYIFAYSYWNVKIFHTIGIHFEFIAFGAYHISKIKNLQFKKSDLIFAQWYLFCQTISALFFCYIQLPMDHEAKRLIFESGSRASGAFILFKSLGLFQDFFVPIYGSIAYFFWKEYAILELNHE